MIKAERLNILMSTKIPNTTLVIGQNMDFEFRSLRHAHNILYTFINHVHMERNGSL